MTTPFVHLHCHSYHSILGGTASPEELVRQAKQYKMPALALTDLCTLQGLSAFYREAVQSAIQPIRGIEMVVAEKSLFEQGNRYGLTLLAMNNQGWQNLVQLATLAFLAGFHDTPCIDKELLRQYNAGLICLSGFAGGEIGHLLINEPAGNDVQAKDAALWYHETFGDRFYLELRNHGVAAQDSLLTATAELGSELGIATVATNDIHYLAPGDWKAHDLLLCRKNGITISDDNRPIMGSKQHYFRTADEMLAAFSGQEDAVYRTMEIAERIEPVGI